MTDQTWTARTVHAELAQMAWEEMAGAGELPDDPTTHLQLHLRKMGQILSDPEKYKQLWERVKRGARNDR